MNSESINEKTSGGAPGSCDLGLIGLAVMGQNLVLNMESKGFDVAIFNRTTSVTQELASEWTAAKKNIWPGYSIEEFVQLLHRPRKIMIMVKAGAAVDAVIAQLLPLLEPGDLIIDGGNSLFTDTIRREKELKDKGFFFIGAGISGGEEGALKGPSIMPGGELEAYKIVEPIFTKIAAQIKEKDGRESPCCTYVGPNGAGHYVKMVHNGIEYGDMQLICEAYAVLKNVLGLSAAELHEVFKTWNKGELDSYLIEITTDIFSRVDVETGQPLVDLILDKAGQKGTGRWTLQSAIELGVVISTINAAVEARVLSSQKELRVDAESLLPQAGVESESYSGDREEFIRAVHDALYASKVISYAQGMDLLATASREHDWNLQLSEMAAIWRGGCIIRAKFLNDITDAFRRDASLRNLMLDSFFTEVLTRTQPGWRKVVSLAQSRGIPVPAFSASLNYFDSFRAARLPHNLLQAQRDYFGAHTYERTDKEGVFHTDWIAEHTGNTRPDEPEEKASQ